MAVEERVVGCLQRDQQDYASQGRTGQPQQPEAQREAQAGGPGGNSCQRKAQEEDVDRVPCGQQPQGGLGRLPFRAAVPAALEEEPGRVGPRRDERPEEQSLRDNAPRPQEL